MTTAVRLTVAAAMITMGLSASSIDDAYSTTVLIPAQPCVSYSLPCQSFDPTVPQFDPSLGKLDSITWAFTDYQSFKVDIDYYTGILPFAYSYTTTVGDTSAILGMNSLNTQTISGILYQYHIASYQDTQQNNLVQASGIVSDDSPFIGTGTVDIPITPYLSGYLDAAVGFGLDDVQDYATLDVTYHYASVIPEPPLLILTFAAVVLLVLMNRRRRQPRAGSPLRVG